MPLTSASELWLPSDAEFNSTRAPCMQLMSVCICACAVIGAVAAALAARFGVDEREATVPTATPVTASAPTANVAIIL